MSHGRMSYDEYVYTLQVAHHQLAKKQRTWFKSQKNTQYFILDQDKDQLNQMLEKIYSL